MFDQEFVQSLARELAGLQVDLLADRVAERLREKGFGTQKDFLTTASAAELLDFTQNAFEKWQQEGKTKLPVYKVDNRPRYKRADLLQIWEAAKEYRESIKARKQAGGEEASASDLEEINAVIAFYELLSDNTSILFPSMPRLAFKDEGAYLHYRRFRTEMLTELVNNPRSEKIWRYIQAGADEARQSASLTTNGQLEEIKNAEQASIYGLVTEGPNASE